jgi:hypothetical protein
VLKYSGIATKLDFGFHLKMGRREYWTGSTLFDFLFSQGLFIQDFYSDR